MDATVGLYRVAARCEVACCSRFVDEGSATVEGNQGVPYIPCLHKVGLISLFDIYHSGCLSSLLFVVM